MADTTRRSSDPPSSPPSPSPLSFLSLPNDVVLNCLSRISRTYHPILYLVSKNLRSLLASPDLQAARSRFKKAEKCLYVCLNLKNNPTWFVLSPTPTKRKLIPIPSFPYTLNHPSSATAVSYGSDIYLIGGSRKGERVFVLDCKSNQWGKLPEMNVPRKQPTVYTIKGKLCVCGGYGGGYGGGCGNKKENYNEIYDPIKQTWELLLYRRNEVDLCGLYWSGSCLLQIEKNNHSFIRRDATVCKGKLRIFNGLCPVRGLEELSSSYFLGVTNPGGQGSRVIVWWKTYYSKECKTEIWCAEILIQLAPYDEFQGLVEWSENVLTLQGCKTDDGSDFPLYSAFVTYD